MVIIDGWPYDLMVTADIQRTSKVTTDPIEDGGATADHIILDPIVIPMEVVVTNTPIGQIALDSTRRVDEVTEAVFGVGSLPLPAEEAYQRLTEIWENKKAVTVELPLSTPAGAGTVDSVDSGQVQAKPSFRIFKNMAITSLTDKLSTDSEGGAMFSVTFTQLTFVTNKKLTVRMAIPAKAKRATQATVGPAYRVDAEVVWYPRLPPGGVRQRGADGNFMWAVVDTTWSDGKGGPGATKVYRFSGEVSSNLTFSVKAGEILDSNLSGNFEKDLVSDAADERFDRQAKITAEQENARDAFDKAEHRRMDNLPDGFDMSRFDEPRANDDGTVDTDPLGLKDTF